MEKFIDILQAGGKTNSLGRAGEVFTMVRNDPSRMDELFECIKAEDAWVRMRAIDTFEKLIKGDPKLVRPYLPLILADLVKSSQPSIQWHLAQIFGEVELNDQQRTDAITWLKSKIASTDVDWIVSVNVMKSLLHFYKAGFVPKEELAILFNVQSDHASKSVRKKAEMFLKEL
jgi:hypothetical protein